MQIVLDVETKRTFEDVGGYFPEKLGVSYVGLCIRENMHDQGEMLGFFEDELPKLFSLLEKAELLIGFNIRGFDLETLRPYYSGSIEAFQVLDLLERIKDAVGHRVSLDAVATQTLGTSKIGHGLDAIRYFNNKEFDKLAEYCLKDVEITRDVYDVGRRTGKIKFTNKWNRLIETAVDFSFSPPAMHGVQMTLL